MRNKILLAYAFLSLTLGACSHLTYQFKGYEKYTLGDKEFKENTRILQITDAHWGIGSQLDLEELYIRELVEQTQPDIIVLGGDLFMHANKEVVIRFFEMMDSFDIPFAYTYGNHDLLGNYHSDYIDMKVKQCFNSLLVNYLDDGLTGRSNYYVNLVDKSTNEIKWQIMVMDSNSYNGGSYDILHKDQVSWYRSIVAETTALNGGVPVPQLFFYHIPGLFFQSAIDAFNATTEGKNIDCNAEENLTGNGVGCARENVYHGYEDDGIFDAMKELKSTKGVFVGHDHINNFHLEYEGIGLYYNLKCGQNIYFDERLMGGQVIELASAGTFTVTRHFLGYEGLGK